MNELFAYVRERYLDQTLGQLPLHRIAVFVLFFSAVHLTFYQVSSSVWHAWLATPISEQVSGPDGLLARATVVHFLTALFLTWVSTTLANRVRRQIYETLARIRDMNAYVTDQVQQAKPLRADNEAMNLKMASDVESDLRDRVHNMQRLADGAELAVCLAVASILNLYAATAWPVDLLALAICSAVVGLINYYSYTYYVSRVVPHLVMYRVFLGLDVEFGDAQF